jgi:hypothetical protein
VIVWYPQQQTLLDDISDMFEEAEEQQSYGVNQGYHDERRSLDSAVPACRGHQDGFDQEVVARP